MTSRIVYHPRTRRPGIIKRPTFTPFAQDAPQQPIGRQILDYLKFGKPIASPVKAIKTEIIVPTETKKFARQIVFILAGTVIGGIVLYKML